jgi:hypothetical protein
LVSFRDRRACPLLHQHRYAKYLPISSTHSFDNTAKMYNFQRILDVDNSFSEEKYRNYSPLFVSSTFALSYGLSFASITGASSQTLIHPLQLTADGRLATWTHTFIYFHKQIYTQARCSMNEQPDSWPSIPKSPSGGTASSSVRFSLSLLVVRYPISYPCPVVQ